MLLYNALCNGKPQAVTPLAAVSRFIDAIESLKDLLFLTHRDLIPAVGDGKEDLFVFLRRGLYEGDIRSAGNKKGLPH